MAAWVPLAEDSWLPLREVLTVERERPANLQWRTVARWEGGASYQYAPPYAVLLLRRLWPTMEWCGRRTLGGAYERIDWPEQESGGIELRGGAAISRRGGGTYYDVHGRPRSAGHTASSGPPLAKPQSDAQVRTGTVDDMDACILASAVGTKDGKTSRNQLRTDAPRWYAEHGIRPETGKTMTARLYEAHLGLSRGMGKRTPPRA